MVGEWKCTPLDVFGVLPHVQGDGITKLNPDPFSQDPNSRIWLYIVRTDGSLWRMRGAVEAAEQVPSPGDLKRVAVSPDMSVWCV